MREPRCQYQPPGQTDTVERAHQADLESIMTELKNTTAEIEMLTTGNFSLCHVFFVSAMVVFISACWHFSTLFVMPKAYIDTLQAPLLKTQGLQGTTSAEKCVP